MKTTMLGRYRGSAGSIGFALILAGCCGGGSSNSKRSGESNSTPPPTQEGPAAKSPTNAPSDSAKIGESVALDDSVWLVVSAKNAGQTLKSNNQFHPPAKTDGKFIVVNFKITNKTSKEERLLDGPRILDSQGREFKHLDHEAFYVPKDAKTLALEAIPAGMTREFWGVFEVPSDASQLKFQVRTLGLFGSKKLVDLAI